MKKFLSLSAIFINVWGSEVMAAHSFDCQLLTAQTRNLEGIKRGLQQKNCSDSQPLIFPLERIKLSLIELSKKNTSWGLDPGIEECKNAIRDIQTCNQDLAIRSLNTAIELFEAVNQNFCAKNPN
jgi:hypothetical protein